MNGKIFFMDLEQLAKFLKAFTGSTATFEVKQQSNGQWVLTFLEGY
jgi:hypothetical protein